MAVDWNNCTRGRIFHPEGMEKEENRASRAETTAGSQWKN
jgi:hypothetical protein